MSNFRKRAAIALAVAGTLLLTSCSWFDDDAVLVRSDPPINGYKVAMQYSINSSPKGDSEKNEIVFRGINDASPMPLLSTFYGRGAGSKTQLAQITGPDGSAINVLSMNKWEMKVGLTDFLNVQVATYEQRDALGNRVCGAKARLNFQPNIAQVVKDDKYRRAWDSLFYYSVPCGDTAVPTPDGPPIVKPNMVLDLGNAKLLALVIDQQFTPRVTGKPILFNRGHSVTIVGGRAANLVGGWWEAPVGALNASEMIIDMVKDLDRNEWLKFSDPGNGALVYSAGDADVYLSLQRIFLNRQSDYLVNFRSSPTESWKRVLIHPQYNYEWNDLEQNYEALKGADFPDLDDMVDQDTGLPKDIEDPESEDTKKLKEIETAGCQNCPNPTLEQIQFIDATSGSSTEGDPLYAMTIRGWLGAQSSLVMFGALPGSVDSYKDDAEAHREATGMTYCPEHKTNGEELADDKSYTDDSCLEWLREAALWDLITNDASAFEFDVVGQFRVRDSSSWASHCTGSGESTSCTLEAVNRRLDASYLFTDGDEKLKKAWTILQLLGEVGMRTLGMSYASGQYDGSGLNFAMAQPQVYNSYYTDMSDPSKPYNSELLFALDARALQLPVTLGEAADYLYGSE